MAHGLPRVSKRRKKVEKEKQKMYDSPSEERMCMCVCVCVRARVCVWSTRIVLDRSSESSESIVIPVVTSLPLGRTTGRYRRDDVCLVYARLSCACDSGRASRR